MTALLLAVLIAHADPPARARTTLDARGDVWVGQRVTLVVELLSPGPFTSVPAFEVPEVPGVLIVKPEDRAVVGTEEVDGATYTTQRHEFAVFPQRAGTVTIPAFPVRFESSAGFGTPAVSRRVTTTPVAFTAKLPPGAEGLGTIITTSSLALTEKWSPEPGPATVEAAFTRMITVEAKDVPGMALPAIRFDPPEGLRAYPKPPVVEDRVDRGELTGRRVETVTYVCEKPGGYTVPAVVLSWWNSTDRALTRSKLPDRSFEVAATPAPAAETASPAPATSRRVWRWLLLGLAAVIAAWRFAPTLRAWLQRRRAERAESEEAYFRTFRRVCASADAQATHRALLAWLDQFMTSDPTPTATEFADRAADAKLSAMLTALESEVFGQPGDGHPGWSPAELERRVADARSRLSRRTHAHSTRLRLPPLNPVGPRSTVQLLRSRRN